MEIFLDSGAFSAKWIEGKKKPEDRKFKDNTAFLNAYMAFINKYRGLIKYYVNLDVIGDAKRTWENQRIMESNGFKPLPVFHYEDPPKPFLYRCLDNYPYFAMGGMARDSHKKRRLFMLNHWRVICNTPDRTPLCKIHGFGMSSPKIMAEFPWYSVDSTSWVMYGKYGIVIVPKRALDGEYMYHKAPLKVVVSSRSPLLTNPLERKIHFTGWDPKKNNRIHEYFREKGFELGETEIVNGEEVALSPGLSNDHKLRDALNLRYFLDMEKYREWPSPYISDLFIIFSDKLPVYPHTFRFLPSKLKVYLAGNFPQMKDIHLERAAMQDVLKIHPVYRRLISFYYAEDAMNVLKLQMEVRNEDQKRRIIVGPERRDASSGQKPRLRGKNPLRLYRRGSNDVQRGTIHPVSLWN